MAIQKEKKMADLTYFWDKSDLSNSLWLNLNIFRIKVHAAIILNAQFLKTVSAPDWEVVILWADVGIDAVIFQAHAANQSLGRQQDYNISLTKCFDRSMEI